MPSAWNTSASVGASPSGAGAAVAEQGATVRVERLVERDRVADHAGE